MTNRYSPQWFDTFLATIPDRATADEVAFVARQLPVAEFPRLLDLCCGPARHACELAGRGYRVVGVDASEAVILRARSLCPEAEFRVCDMRALEAPAGSFDAAVNLWHSFGYFDDATNAAIVRRVHNVLRPGGRAIFDIYNRDHFAARPAEELSERGGQQIRTVRTWQGARHRITLEYDGQPGDEFEWRLYAPDEFRALCAEAGFATLLACAWFDEAVPISAEHARMQFVLERRD